MQYYTSDGEQLAPADQSSGSRFARALRLAAELGRSTPLEVHKMNMSRFAFLYTPVLVILLLVGCVGDGIVRVKGRVSDQLGNPITHALVKLERRDLQACAITDIDGAFSLSKVVAPGRHEYTFTVSSDGFQSYSGTVPTITLNTCNVVLATSNSEVRSSAECTTAVQ